MKSAEESLGTGWVWVDTRLAGDGAECAVAAGAEGRLTDRRRCGMVRMGESGAVRRKTYAVIRGSALPGPGWALAGLGLAALPLRVHCAALCCAGGWACSRLWARWLDPQAGACFHCLRCFARTRPSVSHRPALA